VAGFRSDDTVERVRQAAEIVDVIGSYVQLKRAGRVFKALCPFHREKTPSFTVNPERQIFKCFGCGVGGDVFSFIEHHEKVSFVEALQILAEKYNIPFQRGRSPEIAGPAKADIYRVNRWAAGVYRNFLCSERGQTAQNYLKKRSISADTARTFGVGYAPDDWDFLSKAAREKGLQPSLLVAAGLLGERSQDGSHYDRFRNRLMFPILDPRGNVIAFGGRTLGDDPAKYLNSPETAVFSKSRTLYALHTAKDVAEQAGFIAIVEGYTDVLAAHQAGIKNVVATLGTAMTADHLTLLGRYVERVVVVFDGDEAGRHAAERAVDAFLASPTEIQFVLIEGELDPCDLIVQKGAQAFQTALGGAIGALAFKIQEVMRRHDCASAVGSARAADEMVELLGTVSDPIRRGRFRKEAAQRLRLSEEDFQKSLQRLKRRRTRGAGSAFDRSHVLPRQKAQELTQVQRDILGGALLSAQLADRVAKSPDVFDAFEEEPARSVLEAALKARGDSKALLGRLETEEAKSLAAQFLAQGDSDPGNLEDRLEEALEYLGKRRARMETRQASLKVRQAVEAGDEKGEREALAEFQSRMARKKNL